MNMTRQTWQLESLSNQGNRFWQDWDRLNHRYHSGHPMLDSRFVSALLTYFPKSVDALCGYSNGERVTILLVERTGGAVRKLYKPSQAQLALALMPEEVMDIPRMLKALPDSVGRLDFFALDPTYHAGMLRQSVSDRQPAALNMIVSTSGAYANYWQDRPKQLKKNAAKYRRRLEADYETVEFRASQRQADMHYGVARYGFVESSGWKGEKGTALHPANPQGNFYRKIMSDFAYTDQALIAELWAEDKLVASRLCIYTSDLFIILKTTYDQSFSAYSVGRLLLENTIRWVFDSSMSPDIDFYTDASRDQLHWSTGTRQLENLSCYRPPLGYLVDGVRRLRRPGL